MAVDQFIKIGDIVGESQDNAHSGEIDVLSWDWGMAQSGTMHSGSGGGGGKVAIQDISITKTVDKATPVLMKACSDGTQFPEAVLTIRKAGTEPLEYLIITMTDVIITSVSTGGSGGEDVIRETTKLNFAQVSVEYQPQAPDGSPEGGTITYGWNIAGNIAL